MLNTVLAISLAMLGLAILLNMWRILRGPSAPDRIIGLDTMYINTIALLVLMGILFDDNSYFESALVIALMGFVSTVALCKYLLRGDIIE